MFFGLIVTEKERRQQFLAMNCSVPDANRLAREGRGKSRDYQATLLATKGDHVEAGRREKGARDLGLSGVAKDAYLRTGDQVLARDVAKMG